MLIMPTFDSQTPKRNGSAVYTIGVGRTKPQEFYELLSALHIDHIFDVRSTVQQGVPAYLRPSNFAGLVAKNGATYHDETKSLGQRPNYQLFALTDEFAGSMQPIVEIGKRSNILIVCAETDYRKCHRKFIASFLSRNGLAVHHIGKSLPTDFQSSLEENMVERPLARRMFTIGFTQKSMREFAELLRTAKIRRLVDIRLRPVSQYSGFAKRDDLEFLLELMGIQYVHTLDLAPTSPMLDGYRSDHNWGKYEHDFVGLLRRRKPDELLDQLLTPGLNVAFLCTEDTPERCHRRLVAEYARRLLPDLEVIHLTSKGSFGDEKLT